MKRILFAVLAVFSLFLAFMPTANAVTVSDTATIEAPDSITGTQAFSIVTTVTASPECAARVRIYQNEVETITYLVNPGPPQSYHFPEHNGFSLGPVLVVAQSVCTSAELARKTIMVYATASESAPAFLFPSDQNQRTLVVSDMTPPDTRVTYGLWLGSRLLDTQSSVGSSHVFSYTPSRKFTPDGIYTFTTEIPGHPTKSSNISIFWGWNPMSFDETGIAIWKPCSTISWHYNPAGAPKKATAAKVNADISKAFSLISSSTGLSFTPTSSSSADIVISWKSNMDADGTGSYEWGGFIYSGSLLLNSRSSWAATSGFDKKGRGSLLMHELGHIIGLDHVDEVTHNMAPTHYFGTTANTYTADEQRGLHYMYEVASCPAYSPARESAPAKVKPLASAPVNVRAIRKGNKVILSWSTPIDNPNKVTRYEIVSTRVTTWGSSWSTIGAVPAKKHSVKLASKYRGKLLSVCARTKAGCSMFSERVQS